MADYMVKTECRLIAYLIERGYSRTKVKQLMRHRAVAVNEKAVQGFHYLLQKGDRISVRKETKKAGMAPPPGMEIIYEDEDIIVIEKPAGLLTIASEKEKTRTAYYQLNKFLKLRTPRKEERIFIVHRLDRDTSGLIVFAKKENVKRVLQKDWQGVEKGYVALVEGRPVKKEGRIRSRLSETASLKVYIDHHSERAKVAETHYRVVKTGREYSLLDIHLETGRKNQIRVHLSDIGHPVAGDTKYGAKTNPLGRLGLHSYRLAFEHPVTNAHLRFESKVPSSFNRLTATS